jgi:Raf kinase inhibitor-like YbhB/YbcL family protein
MKKHLKNLAKLAAGIVLSSSLAQMAHAEFSISSKDITAGEMMPKAQEFAGFGCTGDNLSPELSWADFPKDTKSFAITAYDPDAPTGSGWWHWVLVNIPAEVNQIVTGAGNPDKQLLPKGSQMFRNDYGSKTFGGACPPEGDKAHRYQFKVFALNVEKLELPEDATAALVGYYLYSHAIDTAVLEALYKR